MKKSIAVTVALLISILCLGQTKTVTLVSSGDGASKTEAESVALRSAIEQAFGTFVSANTTIVNDELVKDEIATISSGNIESYQIVNEAQIGGKWNITVKAIVSINKLVEYAQSHGSSTEFAGQNFAMQMKMRKLNKENEEKVLSDLLEKIEWITANVSLYDYEIEQGEPQFSANSLYKIPVRITAHKNQNVDEIRRVITTTFESLSLSDSDQDSYALNNYPMTLFRPLELIFNDNTPFWMRSDKELLDQFVQTINDKIILNLHGFSIVRNGGDIQYKVIQVPFSNNNNEKIREEIVYFLLLEIPEDILFVTEGFSIKPRLEHNISEEANMSIEIIDITADTGVEESEDEAIPLEYVEQKPKFNGGDSKEFLSWINSRLVYPETAKKNGIQGRVTVQFTINADGSVSNVKVLRGIDSSLDKEAVRVVSSSPKWEPGKQRGRPVRVSYNIPVTFIAAAQEQDYVPTPVTVSKEKVLCEGKLYYSHVVREHQTLFSISKAYGVTVQDIYDANTAIVLDVLTPDQILLPNMTLLIPSIEH